MVVNEYDWDLFFSVTGKFYIHCVSRIDAERVCDEISEAYPGITFASGECVSGRHTYYDSSEGEGIYYIFEREGGRHYIYRFYDDSSIRRYEPGSEELLPLDNCEDEYETKELKEFLVSIA